MYCRCCCRCTVQRDVRLLDVATAAAHLPCHSVRAAGRQSSQDVQNHQQEVAADSANLLTSTSTYFLPDAKQWLHSQTRDATSKYSNQSCDTKWFDVRHSYPFDDHCCHMGTVCNFIIRMLYSDMYWLTLRIFYCFVFFACGSAFWHFCN